MVEIAVIWMIASNLGKIAKEKGRRAGWYQFFVVLAWIIGEVVGVVVGILLVRRFDLGSPLLAYGLGIGGAATAASLVYRYVANLPSLISPEVTLPQTEQGAVMPIPPDDGNPYRAPM